MRLVGAEVTKKGIEGILQLFKPKYIDTVSLQ